MSDLQASTTATKLDDRLVSVGFEINGALKEFDGLYIAASGTKFANANQNECEVKIANLSRTDRDYLITETSPFNANRTPKKLIVKAGRKSTGTSVVFVGDIITCTPSQPPDIILTIKAKTGNFMKGKIVSQKSGSPASLVQIAKQVSKNIGASLRFEATAKQISNHAYTGAQSKQIDDVGGLGDVNCYLDDETLVVKDTNVPLNGSLRVLNQNTGMVGIPEITEEGVKVKMLFDNKTTVGGALEISSELNPAANGTFCIYKLSFDIANRDTQFYLVAEAKRLNSQ